MAKALYVIGPDRGPYKVGKTGNVGKRLVALQTASPVKLQVHFTTAAENVDGLEKAVHSLLKRRRLNGEWFDAPLSEIVETIRGYRASVVVTSFVMSAEAFRRWLDDMREQGLARSDAECARQLGISANTVVSLKRDGADMRTALACRALLHRLTPYA